MWVEVWWLWESVVGGGCWCYVGSIVFVTKVDIDVDVLGVSGKLFLSVIEEVLVGWREDGSWTVSLDAYIPFVRACLCNALMFRCVDSCLSWKLQPQSTLRSDILLVVGIV
jgi:hypothetical protein